MAALWRALAGEQAVARFDVVHCFWALPSGAAAALPARALGIPLLLTLPGGDLVSDRLIRYGGRLRWRDRLKLRLILACCVAVTVPSDPMRAHAASLGIHGIRVPLGVALDRWPSRAPLRRTPDAPLRLLHVASLNAVKDQATLLAVVARLKAQALAFSLDVVGEDCLDGAVQCQAEALGLAGSIRFHGFLPHAPLRALFERSDLLVMTSRHEGAPIVCLEAAVAGVPTVGTAVGHIVEMAPHGAVAAPVGDADVLAEAVQALAADEDARLALARTALQCAVAQDADHTASQFVSLYRQLAQPRRERRVVTPGRAAHAGL
jgi:glycosyltransferase involved in cell wall biosynthesis